MRKVILKVKLSSRDKFEQKLSDIDLDFSGVYWQHDRIYVPRDYKKNSNYPRLIMRTEMRAVDKPPKYTLILRRHIEDSGVDIVEETPVTDYEKSGLDAKAVQLFQNLKSSGRIDSAVKGQMENLICHFCSSVS